MDTYEHDERLSIKAGREFRRWSQSFMAELMEAATGDTGWNEARITNIETLRRKVSPGELRIFAEIQGFDTEFYLYGPPQNRRMLSEAKGAVFSSNGDDRTYRSSGRDFLVSDDHWLNVNVRSEWHDRDTIDLREPLQEEKLPIASGF